MCVCVVVPVSVSASVPVSVYVTVFVYVYSVFILCTRQVSSVCSWVRVVCVNACACAGVSAAVLASDTKRK